MRLKWALSLVALFPTLADAADLARRDRPPQERRIMVRYRAQQGWPPPVVSFKPLAGRPTEITYITLPLKTVEEVVVKGSVVRARY